MKKILKRMMKMGLLDYEEYIKYYKEIEYRGRYEI